MEGPTPVQLGDVLLGRYRVESVLGQGGMGVVVAARHMNLGQLFAIKFLLPNAVQQPQAVERFLREARAAAQLRSEHVAKVVDVGQLDTGAPYMVMEHLDGSDLRSLLKARGALPVEEAIMYILQACDALAEAHGLGIVHRDIKPANLFLTRRPNGSPCLKVLDFGISKQLGGQAVDLTNTHTTFGSPLYMSPEQMTRAKTVDTRTDIWSLGIVCYELVTATTPFLAETVTEVVGRVIQEEPVRPTQIRPDVPVWLDSAIIGCLQKNREHRIQTVQDLVQALTLRDVTRTVPIPRSSLPSLPLVTVPMASVSGPSLGTATAVESRTGQTNNAWGNTAGVTSQPQGRTRMVVVGASIFGAVIIAGAIVGTSRWRASGGQASEAVSGMPSGSTIVVTPPPSLPSASVPTTSESPAPSPSGPAVAAPSASLSTSVSRTGASPPTSAAPRPSTTGKKAKSSPTHEPLD